MTFVSMADAPVFSLPGLEFRGLTAPSRGAREICTWHLYVAPERPSDPAHSLDHEEVFVLLEERLAVSINGERTTLAPGDAIAVPAGAQLQLANPDSVTAHALVCIVAGFQGTMSDGQVIGTPPWAQ
jgi:mannose-6-phosphate isomerase-like protein (cupin superfamily)